MGYLLDIEDIILQFDKRGISTLRRFLPSKFCEEAAKLVVDNTGVALIVTGFYIIDAGMPETDGPPGALAIGRALEESRYTVYYVTDQFTEPIFRSMTDKAKVIIFPLDDDIRSQEYAKDILRQYRPSLLISIERCGLNKDRVYLDMRGKDISKYNARIDYLFDYHTKTIGIGDGGNEIGMGKLADVIPVAHPNLAKNPCVTEVTNLIVASVSNWGAYGLLAALSRLMRRNLLPLVEKEWELIERIVAIGAVDGVRKKQIAEVDGFSEELYCRILAQQHQLLAKDGIGSFCKR